MKTTRRAGPWKARPPNGRACSSDSQGCAVAAQVRDGRVEPSTKLSLGSRYVENSSALRASQLGNWPGAAPENRAFDGVERLDIRGFGRAKRELCSKNPKKDVSHGP